MEKKRLTLTGNKIPEDIYKKLEQLGNERKLTPYIVNLIEKEDTMDQLIKHLSTLTNKMDNVEHVLSELNQKFETVTFQKSAPEIKIEPVKVEVVQEGKLNISSTIEGGIEEDTEMNDY